MKTVIVIGDGVADRPQAALGGLTPLEHAFIPNLTFLAQRGRTGNLVLALVGLLLLGRAIPQADEITTDTQSVQARTIEFVDRNFPRDMRGFHPEKALFHRHDPSPFGVFFYPHIRLIFFGADGSTNTENFIEEFRKRPVAFLVDSHRLRMFPPRVQQFWARHYVRYAEGVYVAGTMLKGDAGTKVGFEVLAPGEYKLILPAKHPKARIDIDGTTVEPGSTLSLEAGVHRIELLDPIELALFTLNLPEPPDTSTFHPFYDPIALAELDGTRRWSWVPGF